SIGLNSSQEKQYFNVSQVASNCQQPKQTSHLLKFLFLHCSTMILSWTLQCGSLISALVFILNVFIGTTTAQYHHRPNDHLSVFPRHLDLTGLRYSHEREYSPKLARIYRRYLDRGTPLSPQCYSTDLD